MFYKSTLIWCFLFLQLWYQIRADANLADHKLSGIIQWKYEKRPFCNAFTGCGRKRTSSDQPYPIIKRQEINKEQNSESDDYMYEGLSDLFDVNAEPAVENVQNKIMSNAKIYEALKEASKEILRQKNKQRLRNRGQQEERPLWARNENQPKYPTDDNV